jgi:hypothetical protein
MLPLNTLLDFQIPLLPCASKSLLGIDCPICGFQRSLLHLLNGNLYDSLLFYAPLIPSLILILLFLCRLIMPQTISLAFLKQTGLFVLILIIVNYLTKMMVAVM